MFEHYRCIHFIGIGGIGMSGIAEVLINLGYEVTGSDLKESETTDRLKSLGAAIYAGHSPKNIAGAHVVVVTSAVSGKENPEVREATRLGIPVIPRAEMLAELGRLKYSVLVAGAHGKTTTTSLISSVLGHAGFDPTVVIGGKLNAIGTNARLGQGDFLVAEADESDGSFLKLSPTVGVVTNIDNEHMDYFLTMEALKAAFLSFMNKVPFYGVSVLCVENEHIRELLPSVHRRVLTYGFTEAAELRAIGLQNKGMSVQFDVSLRGDEVGRFSLSMPGRHNVLNALAAIGVALELRVPAEKIQEALSGFEGIHRRLQFKGQARDIRVFDDYGHHPVEIQAVIGALKDSLAQGGGRLVVMFQPHRYSRTSLLFDEFAGAFDQADAVFLLDIYAASEKPIPGVTSEALYEALRQRHGQCQYLGKREGAHKRAASMLKPGDTLLTLGAGDVYKAGEALLEELKQPL